MKERSCIGSKIKAGPTKIPESKGEKVKVAGQAPDLTGQGPVSRIKLSNDEDGHARLQSQGDYNLPSNSTGRVGIKNKWGNINQLKAGPIKGNKQGIINGKKRNPAIRINRKGKTFKPGEVPPDQNLISRYLTITTSRSLNLNPEEE